MLSHAHDRERVGSATGGVVRRRFRCGRGLPNEARVAPSFPTNWTPAAVGRSRIGGAHRHNPCVIRRRQNLNAVAGGFQVNSETADGGST